MVKIEIKYYGRDFSANKRNSEKTLEEKLKIGYIFETSGTTTDTTILPGSDNSSKGTQPSLGSTQHAFFSGHSSPVAVYGCDDGHISIILFSTGLSGTPDYLGPMYHFLKNINIPIEHT